MIGPASLKVAYPDLSGPLSEMFEPAMVESPLHEMDPKESGISPLVGYPPIEVLFCKILVVGAVQKSEYHCALNGAQNTGPPLNSIVTGPPQPGFLSRDVTEIILT